MDANKLDKVISETITKLAAKKVAPEVANALASLAREKLRIKKTHLEVLNMTGTPPSAKLVEFFNGRGLRGN